MLPLVAIPLACWLCALLAIPRSPNPCDELQELAYRRLVGRQQLLVGCATLATLVIAIIVLVNDVSLTLADMQR